MKQLSQRPRTTALRAVRPLLLMACVQPFAHAQPLPAAPIKAQIIAPSAAFNPSPANPAQKSVFNTAAARTPITQMSDFQSRSDSEIITNAQGKSITMGEVKRGINANIHQAQTRIEPSETDSQKTPVKIKRESRELAKFEQFRSALHGRVSAELSAAKSSAQALAPMVAKVPQGTASKAQSTVGSASLVGSLSGSAVNPGIVTSRLCPPGGVRGVAGAQGGRFDTTPRAGVLVRGCFGDAGQKPVEIRINGQFSGGHLNVPVDSKGDDFAYGSLPDVRGAYDQDVTLSVKYSNGSSSNEIRGHFTATREAIKLDPANVPGYVIRTAPGAKQETPNGNVQLVHGTGTDNQRSGSDVYVPALASGFEVTGYEGYFHGDGAELVWSGDGWPQINWRAHRKTKVVTTYLPCVLGGPFACFATGGKDIVIDRSTKTTDSASVLFDSIDIVGPAGVAWRR
jgi:hypothetical protein